MLKYVSVPLLLIATSASAETVTDVTKRVIQKTPYQVEVCQEQAVSGDKTGDALIGAIIGGALGNNIKGEENGGAIGAVLGAMAGHANSKATGGSKVVCKFETRFNEVEKTIYSHSIVTFTYEGRTYSISFQK